METQDITENSIVCFRREKDPEEVLMARWTSELRTAYEFAHSLPYTPQKGNREPIFPEAVWRIIPVVDQTLTNLIRVYSESKKDAKFRTKIHSYNLLCLLTE